MYYLLIQKYDAVTLMTFPGMTDGHCYKLMDPGDESRYTGIGLMETSGEIPDGQGVDHPNVLWYKWVKIIHDCGIDKDGCPMKLIEFIK